MQEPEPIAGGLAKLPEQGAETGDDDGVFIAPEHANVISGRQYVLKSDDTFVVNQPNGDILGHDDGLFVNDTRVLSQLQLTFGGRAPSLLSGSVSSDNTAFTAHLTNRPLPPLGGEHTPQGVIHVERLRVLRGNVLNEAIALTHYGTEAADVPLSISFASDFLDIFEVRGSPRGRRGTLVPPYVDNDAVVFGYQGLDNVERIVRIAFSPAPDRLLPGRADYTLTLPSDACLSVYLQVTIVTRPLNKAAAQLPGSRVSTPPAGLSGAGRAAVRAALAESRRMMRDRRRASVRLRSSNPLFNAWMERSFADLGLLTTDRDTGPYPYAGIPWFSTPFGRDAVMASLQTLWVQPALTRGVLRFLAAHQAREDSAFRDAAVGKIMHEMRKSEMAATGEVPFALYYGGVDTTPLFIVLAGAYLERTGDAALIDELWLALERAAQWIARVCDRNPFGLLDYQRAADSGLANQGWKDSHDSVFHSDGRIPDGPIALVEVQAYTCAAFETMARLAQHRGAATLAAHYTMRAEALRERVEAMFWMPQEGFYGMALDGHGQLCRVLASNAGHLLAFGLPEKARGEQVARTLGSALFHTGWGLRTLAGGQPRFNPMSYHNGSVWPHDTALCARGMARYGEKDAAVRLLQALFEAAVNFDMRLPELFCGFTRRRGEPPTAYPVACLPQAWAAGSPFMMLEACLGVTVDAQQEEVRIERPRLPEGIDWLEVGDLRVGSRTVSLTFHRVGEQVVPAVDRGDARVLALL